MIDPPKNEIRKSMFRFFQRLYIWTEKKCFPKKINVQFLLSLHVDLTRISFNLSHILFSLVELKTLTISFVFYFYVH